MVDRIHRNIPEGTSKPPRSEINPALQRLSKTTKQIAEPLFASKTQQTPSKETYHNHTFTRSSPAQSPRNVPVPGQFLKRS